MMEPDSIKVFHPTITRNHETSQNKEQQDTTKVFHSNITRGNRASDNNLYDLINVQPASPKWALNRKENTHCDFVPKTDKYYIPKKRSKLKVKTVRDIRQEYEKDVYSYLNSDLEKQQNILLKKISAGSAKDNNTKILAKNIVKSSNPISRPAWQMLMNLNPEDQPNNIQFVLWNGKRIRVNGSRGGKNKFLCNHDLSTRKTVTRSKPKLKKKALKKIGLLRNSLSVNFKPGPLTKKKALDDSYQKYNVGDSELVNLPKPCLEIQPTFGIPLEPKVMDFLYSYRNIEGTICDKWAEFSVSVLGSTKNTEIYQNNSLQPITFELQYKSNQKRILMRHDIDGACYKDTEISDHTSSKNMYEDDLTVIRSVMDDMLKSVEINLLQDEMYTGIEDPRASSPEDSSKVNKSFIVAKENPKRKLKELDRLDVTIIRIPEGSEDEKNENCQNDFCSLGCICNSLRCDYKLKQHCGHVECIFECKCDFTKYKTLNSLDALLPGLLNLNEEINLKLAKEEQKFHQTVVVTKEKSILLKPEKRNWKATKRYSEFYRSMNLRADMKNEPQLSIVDVKLNCDNVEPWCMVHCLYKCFCKGKFVDTVKPDKLEFPKKEVPTIDLENSRTNTRSRSIPDKLSTTKKDMQYKSENIAYNFSHSNKKVEINELKNYECEKFFEETSICARVEPYTGRKYEDSYYKSTNKKIVEMERNDSNLHKKMISLVYKNDGNNSDTAEMNTCLNPILCHSSILKKTEEKDADFLHSVHNEEVDNLCKNSANANDDSPKTVENATNSEQKSLLIKNKLMAWVEVGYKQYKQRFQQGKVKLFLEPPKQGKLALYPSEFILNRYREKKNLFLITKNQPMRIFLAVNVKNTFFDNCLNIDDIRFADLHKYPETIKNLLTNANCLRNTFFIMCGLTLCWEIIGSVTKVNDNTDENTININSHNNLNNENPQFCGISNTEENVLSTRNDELESNETSHEESPLDNQISDEVFMFNCDENPEDENSAAESDSEISKWFVMTIENDFSEIRFYKRGFFVKYVAIIKAINVARMSNKAVRLSAPQCTDNNSATPFGIYAIPNTKEYCVYIGPYEKDESLGIETVKTFNSAQKISKGVWIITKKIDNLKVIDSPLSFMPPADLHPSKIVSLESPAEPFEKNIEIDKNQSQSANAANRILKIVKPIKIRKTNGFYHLAPKPLNKVTITPNRSSVSVTSSASSSSASTSLNQSVLLPSLISMKPSLLPPKRPHSLLASSQSSTLPADNKKPVAEIAPQIKIVGVYTEVESMGSTQNHTVTKRPEGGMFILKPEEINKRVMLNKGMQDNTGSTHANSIQSQTQLSLDMEINQDIENFLATYEICNPPNADVDMIPVDDDDKKSSKHKDIWIECLNVDKLGWIRGRRDGDNNLCFEFPGFKFTDYYSEDEAFSKINQVLSRKIYIPKTLQPRWHVVEEEDNLKTKSMIQPETFGSDFVLTMRGPCHKRDLLRSSKKIVVHEQVEIPVSNNDFIRRINMNLEEQSQSLEEEGDNLLQEFKEKGESFRTLYTVPDDQRAHLSDSLKNIVDSDAQ